MKLSLLTASVALALIAAPAVAQDKLKIGMTFQELNNPYFVSMQEALKESCRQHRCGCGRNRRRSRRGKADFRR